MSVSTSSLLNAPLSSSPCFPWQDDHVRHLAVLLILLTGCAAPHPQPLPQDFTRLEITAGVSDAAMGLRVMTLEMKNTGTRPYVVNGYPSVQVLDDEQKLLDIQTGEGSLGISTVDGFDDPPKQLTVKPGEKVVSSLLWRNTVTRSDVVATSGAYLDVAPARGEAAQRVHPGQALDLGNTGKLGVSPWSTPPPASKGDVSDVVPR
jgi:Protein of unknown function (DUF4232)